MTCPAVHERPTCWPEGAKHFKTIIPAKWYPDNRPNNWVLHAGGLVHFR